MQFSKILRPVSRACQSRATILFLQSAITRNQLIA
jgi:hypothetical protein